MHVTKNALQDYINALNTDSFQQWDEFRVHFSEDLLRPVPHEERIEAFKAAICSDSFKEWMREYQVFFVNEALRWLPGQAVPQARDAVIRSDFFRSWLPEDQMNFSSTQQVKTFNSMQILQLGC